MSLRAFASQNENNQSDSTSITQITESHVRVIRDAQLEEPINIARLREQYKDIGGRRIAPRYPLHMTAIIYSPTKSVRSKTVNISLSGVLLKEMLPLEFGASDLEIVFIHEHPGTQEKRYMMFRASVVDLGKPSARLKFSSALKTASKDLEELLERSQLSPL